MILCEIDILMYTLSNVASFQGGLSLLYVRFIPYVSSGMNMKVSVRNALKTLEKNEK